MLNLRIFALLCLWALQSAWGYMGKARNEMLKNITETNAKWVGLYETASAITAIKSKAASEEILEKAAHGLLTGEVIYLKSVTGGSGLVKTGEFFYVEKVSATEFKLSQTSAFVAEVFSEVTAMEAQKCTEVSGGTYKRKEVKWETAAKAVIESKAAEKYEVPCSEGTKVGAVGFFSAEAAGTLGAIEKVTEETVGAAKAYVVTSATFDLKSQ